MDASSKSSGANEVYEEGNPSFPKKQKTVEVDIGNLGGGVILPFSGDAWETKEFSSIGTGRWKIFEDIIDEAFIRRSYMKSALQVPRPDSIFKTFIMRTYPLTLKREVVCFSVQERAERAARHALDFYNNKKSDEGKSFKFHGLRHLNAGVSYNAGEIYFMTIAATEDNSEIKSMFQACVFKPDESNALFMHSFRPKPKGVKVLTLFI